MNYVYTQNLKAAATLAALGFKQRNPDPIEDITTVHGRSIIFFFEDSPAAGIAFKEELTATKALQAFDKAWQEYILGEEHPLYYIKAGLENRERLMTQMKECEPLLATQYGDKTVLISRNASQKTKNIIKKLI